jgi:broad specificity phosphatase PhoE
MLRTLIVVRHGMAAESGLSDQGREQVARLGESLTNLVDGRTVVITSPVMRAKESARILADRLGAGMEEHECLRAENNASDDQFERTVELVNHRSGRYETVILSTHMSFVQRFPTFWGKKHGHKIPELSEPGPATARITTVATGRTIWTRP